MNPASSFGVPHTQNTAPVLEFRCLYTQDLKRKQKRWQDGRVKFHTFNKRVMVYDDRGNFVGDTHWKDSEFNEGEQLELERGGVIVDVQDCLGKRDQDLSELVDKRVKDKEERAAARIAHGSPTRGPPTTTLSGGLLRPKSLNSVIGTPTGHYGRALASNLSPFQQKQQVDQKENTERPAKRRKQNSPPSKSGYAQNLMGATLTLSSSRPPSTATIRCEPFRASVQRSQANTVDLTLDEESGDDSVAKERPAKQSSPSLQKNKSRRSPPSKSGYASSLTGASLNLDGSGFMIAKPRVAEPESAGRAKPRLLQQPTDSSRLEDIFTSSSIPSFSPPSKPRVIPREKQNERPNENNKPKPSEPPQKPNRPEKVSKEPKKNVPSKSIARSTPSSNAVEDSLVARLIADRPVTTLRIKSRAPRKLMMLMDLHQSRDRSPATTESSGRTASNSKSTQRRSPEPTLPPVVQSLGSTLEEYEDGSSLDMTGLPSSPADKGIDHRTIDALLSRRNMPPHAKDDSQQQIKMQHPLVNPMARTNTSTSPCESKPSSEADPASLTVDEASEQVQLSRVALLNAPDIVSRSLRNKEVDLQKEQSSPPAFETLDEILASREGRSSILTTKTDIKNEVSTLNSLQPTLKSRKASSPALQESFEVLKPTNEVLAAETPQPAMEIPQLVTNLQQERPAASTVNGTKDVPKIINPATRGQTVQVLANKTLNAAALENSRDMLPPAARGLARPVTVQPASKARGGGPVQEPVGDNGPWSRESFDLFGTWRPPGRESIITG